MLNPVLVNRFHCWMPFRILTRLIIAMTYLYVSLIQRSWGLIQLQLNAWILFKIKNSRQWECPLFINFDQSLMTQGKAGVSLGPVQGIISLVVMTSFSDNSTTSRSALSYNSFIICSPSLILNDHNTHFLRIQDYRRAQLVSIFVISMQYQLLLLPKYSELFLKSPVCGFFSVKAPVFDKSFWMISSE